MRRDVSLVHVPLLKLAFILFVPYLAGFPESVPVKAAAGVLFQDFVRYFCTLRENVNFGDVMHPDAPVDTALAAAGVADLAARMPEGLDSQLGRMFDGGAELSMGQWQRLAIARALQSDAPLLLLDEPMAWLDTDARQQLADRLEKMKENKIIILITHT